MMANQDQDQDQEQTPAVSAPGGLVEEGNTATAKDVL